MAANIAKFVRILNIVLGVATIGLGAYVTVGFILKITTFNLKFLPQYLMPFFFALFGVLVLSREFDMPYFRRNCQFVSHPVGIIFFYFYLSSVMAYFSKLDNLDTLTQTVCEFAAFGYIVAGVTVSAIACCGTQGVDQRMNNLTKKITEDE